MLFLLKSLNFFVNLLTLKHEIDSRPQYMGEYLLKSGTNKINRIILDSLHSVLRNDVVFISICNTESLFRDVNEGIYKQNCNSLVMFSKGHKHFTKNIILLEDIPLLKKNRVYFFIDQTRKFIPLFREFDLECVDFEYSLNYFKGSTIVDIFIGLFKKMSNCNIKYGDTQFTITVYKNLKEMKLTNYHIGTIHKTQYYDDNPLYNEIEKHFVEFYNNDMNYNVLNTSFLDLSEKYINSFLNLMIKKGILHKGIKGSVNSEDVNEGDGKKCNLVEDTNNEENTINEENNNIITDFKEGLIEDLFPFEFYKGITRNVEENTFITGGICFDQILKNKRLREFVNKEKIKKLGTRFIMTGCLRKSKNKMYLEMV